MDLKLTNKRAIVTGGTRGIGRAIVEALIAEGVTVSFCARSAGEVEEAVATLRRAAGNVHGAAVDIADAPNFKTWIADAIAQMGGLDILICNASAVGRGSSEEAWAANFEVDVMGAQRAGTIALPHLEEAAAANGDAAIIFVSSVSAAETGFAQAYGAMKAALIHFTKGLAKEAGAKRVRVNAISPGTVRFPGGFWDRAETDEPQMFKRAMSMNPLGRMGRPEEIAAMATFLASPVSSFTTGANIIVDGAITSRVSL